MPWCKICKGLILFPDRHVCSPQWAVWDKDCYDDGEEPYKVYARDPQEAVEKLADILDSDGDYYISEGTDVMFVVETDEGMKQFAVNTEVVTKYYATEVKETITE